MRIVEPSIIDTILIFSVQLVVLVAAGGLIVSVLLYGVPKTIVGLWRLSFPPINEMPVDDDAPID